MRTSVLKSALALAVFTLMVSLLPAVSQAAGPEWAGGFPKLAQKNALLQWNPVKGATGYKVYRGEQKGKVRLIATVKVNRYIDKDVPAGKTLYYEVSAIVAGAEGAHSAVGTIKTAAEKVFVPLKTPALQAGHVKEEPDGKVSVGIRWEGAGGTDLVGVNVYRSKVKGKDYALVGSSSSDVYEDKDVQRSTTYYYVVTSVDSQFNETKYSNEISVNVPAPPAKETAKEAAKVQTTTMRPAKLLFRIPREEEKSSAVAAKMVPANAVGVAVDEAVGHIYVACSMYGGVLVYDMDGKLQFGIKKDGVSGTENFGAAANVAVGPGGNIYVTDNSGPDIYVYDFSGKPVRTIHVEDSSEGGRSNNYDIVMGPDGKIYLTVHGANGIYVLDEKGRRITEIIGEPREGAAKKSGKPWFNGPMSLTLTKDGDIVFVDAGWSRLLEFSPGGRLKKTIGRIGNSAGELNFPAGLTLDNKGNILVGSGASPNVQAFSTDGKFLYALCNEKCDGPLDGVSGMKGMCIDSKGRLYIAEGLADRVSVFQLEDHTVDIVPPK